MHVVHCIIGFCHCWLICSISTSVLYFCPTDLTCTFLLLLLLIWSRVSRKVIVAVFSYWILQKDFTSRSIFIFHTEAYIALKKQFNKNGDADYTSMVSFCYSFLLFFIFSLKCIIARSVLLVTGLRGGKKKQYLWVQLPQQNISLLLSLLTVFAW